MENAEDQQGRSNDNASKAQRGSSDNVMTTHGKRMKTIAADAAVEAQERADTEEKGIEKSMKTQRNCEGSARKNQRQSIERATRKLRKRKDNAWKTYGNRRCRGSCRSAGASRHLGKKQGNAWKTQRNRKQAASKKQQQNEPLRRPNLTNS